MSQLIQVIVTGLGQGGIYVLIGFGFSIVMLACKILNLSHGSYVLYGAFIFLTWSSAVGVPPILLIPPIVAVVALAGLATERILDIGVSPWRQIPSYSMILRTLALLTIFEGIAFLLWGSDSHPTPPVQPGTVTLGGALIAWQLIWVFVVAVVLTGLFSLFLHRTWFGLAIRASAENPLTAYLLGIDRRVIGLVAFGIAAGVGALTGTLISPVTWVDYSAAGFFMLKGTLVYLIGGEEAVTGPLAGGLFLGLTENLLLLIPGGVGGFLKEVVPLAILIAVLMLRPQGLVAPRRVAA